MKTSNIFVTADRTLKLGDFAFCVEMDGERRALPVLVERKKISDLVARSGAGDHMEQLRRMAAVPGLWPPSIK